MYHERYCIQSLLQVRNSIVLLINFRLGDVATSDTTIPLTVTFQNVLGLINQPQPREGYKTCNAQRRLRLKQRAQRIKYK